MSFLGIRLPRCRLALTRNKIYADANMPRTVGNELSAAGLLIESTIETGYSTHPDENIYKQAEKRGKVLPTMDKDFWDDQKYPLQSGPGVIFVDIPPDQPCKAIDGLARFYVLFAKYYPLNWWEGTKARITNVGLSLSATRGKGKSQKRRFVLRMMENFLLGP